ncbi:hypothetical protein M885DRAFT_544100 [Pelagophyceae sp. CCMP2097]|nr:hypothetical protein M885DRAFT_544100 [Pelagophyceae sp. CCMP2097]
MLATGRLPRRLLFRARFSSVPPAAEKPSPPFPKYLIAIFSAAGAAGVATVGVLTLTHEPGLRCAAESVAPGAVDWLRKRGNFPDEDAEYRAYAARLDKELFADRAAVPVAVRGAVLDEALPANTTVEDVRGKVGLVVGQLDLDFADLSPMADDEHYDEAVSRTAAYDLEVRINDQVSASLWAPPVRAYEPSAAEALEQKRSQLEALNSRRAQLGAELQSGRREVDDVRAELAAIDDRIRELNPRRFNLF